MLGQRRNVEIAAVYRPCRLRVIDEAGRRPYVVGQVARMSASDVADLIAAAHIGFSFSKPRKFPGEADGRPEIVPVLREDGLVRFGGPRPDKLDLRLQTRIDAVVRAHPVAETAARYAEQRQPVLASGRPYRQSLSFIRHSVIFPADAGIQSE